MNAITPTLKPCRTVAEWLACHRVTKCPPGHALGSSEMELRFGTTATDPSSWYEQVRQRQANEVRAKNLLRSGTKSRK